MSELVKIHRHYTKDEFKKLCDDYTEKTGAVPNTLFINPIDYLSLRINLACEDLLIDSDLKSEHIINLNIEMSEDIPEGEYYVEYVWDTVNEG